MGEFTDNLEERVIGWAKWRSDAPTKVDDKKEKELKETARELGKAYEDKYDTGDEAPFIDEFLQELGVDAAARHEAEDEQVVIQGDGQVGEYALASLIVTDHVGWVSTGVWGKDGDVGVGANEAGIPEVEDFEKLLDHYKKLVE